jgi:hypothetical protein
LDIDGCVAYADDEGAPLMYVEEGETDAGDEVGTGERYDESDTGVGVIRR